MDWMLKPVSSILSIADLSSNLAVIPQSHDHLSGLCGGCPSMSFLHPLTHSMCCFTPIISYPFPR
jgi:hypothetical protein